MIVPLNHYETRIAEQIVSIQRPAYQIEADLIGSDRIPGLYDTVEDIKACAETFIGWYVGDHLAGFISYVWNDATVDIHRLVVSPSHFREGIAKNLLSYILHFEAERIIVSTGAKNVPARKLYASLGFREREYQVVEDGLSIVHYEY
ncbi:GNAT family N-acetyltransferase [Halobacillus sp. A1]|uniref:GNAT family N-acetyltransferase n=1 Tax=Halobacillus sp. A1 TaxID=2880262 RepID=UPI0020A667DF|nr:GNAT family N-acetyltransferase [Halobacillus sp. A1]MCP3031808.1 GNAT family N-acetyltransferase [Halobacillus sp. A1]